MSSIGQPAWPQKDDDLKPSVFRTIVQRLYDWWNMSNSGVYFWDNINTNEFSTQVVSKTSAYTATGADVVILVDSTGGAVTITLPTAVNIKGRWYLIKDWKGQAATHNITIATTGGQTIDGATSKVFTRNYISYFVVSDGANWSTMAEDFGVEQLKAPTAQTFTSGTGTYTTPTNPSPLYIRVKMVGGGSGGAGSGPGSTAGGNGGATTFGTAFMSCGGGQGGGANGNANSGIGGSPSGSGPIILLSLTGGEGTAGGFISVGNSDTEAGGTGAFSPWGGAGGGGYFGSNGYNAISNTGSGGGGGGYNPGAFTAGGAGAGGSAGAYQDFIISSPSATYAYAIGGGGTAGAAGVPGFAGGAGGSGFILVEEYYQ